MKKTALLLVTAIVTLSMISGCGPSSKLSVPERQGIISDMEKETLQKFYAQDSSIKGKVEGASGYGVFANANINLFIASAGSGYGVVVDNATGKRTYMKMALGGVGFGLGVKDYRQLLVFKSKNAVSSFIDSGWEFGGHADAAAKAGDSGAEGSVEGAIGGDIEAFSLTESGLALQATVAGTKYWEDKDLN